MHGQITDITFCGYDTLPFIANTEGQVSHWDKLVASFHTKERVHIACAKVNEDIPAMNRYISFYMSGAQSYPSPFLYRLNNDKLEDIKWNPLTGQFTFLKIQITAKVIGILFLSSTFTINLYSTENLSLLHSLEIQFPLAFPSFKLDSFGSVLLSTSVHNKFIYYYGPKYQFNKTVVLFRQEQALHQMNDVGWYQEGAPVSKFNYRVVDMSEINVTRHQKEVQFKIGKNSGEVVVDIKELKEQNEWFIFCDARKFYYDFDNKCFVETDKCEINMTQYSQSSCLQEHKSGLGLIKMVYVIEDGNDFTMTYFQESSDEQSKNQNQLLILILAVLLIFLLTAMVYLRWRFVRRSQRKITLCSLLLCDCCKKSKRKEKLDLQKEDTYSQLSD